MERKILILILLPLLTSCFEQPNLQNEHISDQIIEIEHSYDEIELYSIQWNNIFDVERNDYFVYFYSNSCSHCLELKNWIIEKALSRGDIYFVKGTNKDVLKTDVKYTIGLGNVGDFAILGYPSLVQIKDKIIKKNVAGKKEIQSLLT